MHKLLIALCLIASASAWAGIGTVVETKGTACEITRGKNKLPGAKGADIESMDMYVTGGCVSNISFKDDTKVKVTENSRLLIDDFVFDPNKSDAGKLALKVGMGTVRYASGQIAKTNPQQVNIKTPTASIAVRGTDFAMTVDESGQSLVVLVPSCKEDEKVKEYELEENKCRVGKIIVETLMGSVTLDQAFHGTFVTSANMVPTAPTVMSIVEAKISNNLIIVRPIEIVRAVNNQNGKTKQEKEQQEEQEEQTRRINEVSKKDQEESQARILAANGAGNNGNCNPTTKICVIWEKPDSSDIATRGKGVAYRLLDNEHYAEIKTQGYPSNTYITVVQNDSSASELIGDGSPGGNSVTIRQNSGLRKR
jgi:hypothetical protein